MLRKRLFLSLPAALICALCFAPSSSAFPQEPDKPAKDESSNPADKPAEPAQKAAGAKSDNPRGTIKSKGDLTFDDLKFDIEKGAPFVRSLLPKSIEDYNKKTIKIRGYILPNSVFKQKGIDEFVLVRDNQECCFGPGAAIYDCIMIKMEKGVTTDFTTRPIAVKGKFEIEEFKFPDGTHYAIYKMTATEAK